MMKKKKDTIDKVKKLIRIKLEETRMQCDFKKAFIPPGWSCVQTKVFSEEMTKALSEEGLIETEKVYVVGQIKGGDWPDTNWDLYGIFRKREDAVKACKDETYFVGPAPMNTTLGEKTVEWPDIEYPIKKE